MVPLSHAFLLACLLLLSLLACPGQVLAGERPHVLLILVDDMGYGDLSSYNPESRIQTPHLDALAHQGMRFTDAHASGPLCHVSRYGLMTGQYPFRANPGAWRTQATIDPTHLTLAGFLRQQGYRTAMVGKWHLGFDEKGYDRPLTGGPIDRGFDRFFGIRASTDIPPYFYIRQDRAVLPPTSRIAANQSEGWSPIQGAFWREGGIAPGLELKDVLPRLTEEAIEVIDSHSRAPGDDPLFLYLAYPAPHTPWLPSEEFVGRSEAGMYGDFMMMVDHMIGRVLGALEGAGMSEDTMVVFSSDNGPVWYKEDVLRLGHDASGGLRGMKADAWEAGHRVPLIVRWPDHVVAGSHSQQLVSFVDIMPTLATVLGQTLPEGAAPDGKSFASVLKGDLQDKNGRRETLVLASGNGTMTLRDGHWKLIQGLGSGGFSKPAKIKPTQGGPIGQLYHLGRDPGEASNLFASEPQRVASMQEKLASILADQ
ncbi:MAG: sulfatase family protein [Limisphaerales bacterium]